MSARSYLEKLVDEWARLLATPGRRLQSLEEASFDAWIKLYKPDESNLNTTVTYYLKGGLVATALDLEVRRRSDGRRRLADVLGLLWREFAARGMPYPEEVEPLFERATGLSLTAFFDRSIRGADDPDLAGELLGVGLELRSQWDKAPDPGRLGEGLPLWLGATSAPGAGGAVKVTGVLDGTPAQRGGLSPGDEIVAVDGLRILSEADLRARLAARLPGERVELALFRRNRLLAVSVGLEKSPPTKLEIAPVADPSAAQRAAYQDWLGEPFPEVTVPGAGTPAALATVATAGRWI
jgi:predicted metalloprotease with PDZ domain